MINRARVAAFAVLATLCLTGCADDSGGGGDDSAVPASDESTADESIAEVDAPPGLQPVPDGAISQSLNQRLYCEAGSAEYSLTLRNTGQVEYSDDDGGAAGGRYRVAEGRLVVELDTGDAASSIGHVVAGTLLVGVKLQGLGGTVSDCIAREHATGDRLSEDVVVRCGRRNVTGAEENTFTLRTDGSSLWRNVFEIPNDTLFETRLGTFLLDAASGTVLMAYKQLDGDEILYFGAVGTERAFEMRVAPDSGSGSSTPAERCDYL